jgi:hypothetical protein
MPWTPTGLQAEVSRAVQATASRDQWPDIAETPLRRRRLRFRRRDQGLAFEADFREPPLRHVLSTDGHVNMRRRDRGVNTAKNW